MAESKVEEKYIEASKNGNLPDVPELRCYILCMFEHTGMIEDDGEIHFRDVEHFLTPELKKTVHLVTTECATKRKHFLRFTFYVQQTFF